MNFKLQSPLKNWLVLQPFGANFASFYKDAGLKGHTGIDLRAPDGTEIYAAHDGRVTYAGYDGAGGLIVVIRTEEKYEYKGKQVYFKTVYAHLKTGSIKVTASQNVKAGELIALADNTGRSTGAHLHFTLKPAERGEPKWQWYNLEPSNGYNGAIDPLPYFNLPKFIFTQTLRLGSRGEEVQELQKALFLGSADGIFGGVTRGAVVMYQRAHNLVPDGVVGPLTREELNK